MQYSLTEEQLMVKDMVSRLAKEKIAPGAGERDEKAEFSWEMVEVLRENGLFAADFPKEYGGEEMGLLTVCLIVEEIAMVCAATSLIPAVHELGTMPLFLAANKEQKEKYLPKLASGEYLAAFGLTEPNAGSDVAGLQTKAVRDGNDYVLNGRKIFISHGDVAKIISMAAKTDLSIPGHKGTSMFIVEQGTPGLTVGKHENKLGIRGSSTVELIMEDMRIPKENLLGEEGQGFAILMKTLDFTRIVVAAQAVGIAQGALDYAVQYTKDRVQFGKPIYANQGIQWMVAEMAAKLEAARQLTYKAAALYQTLPKNLERLSVEAVRYSAMSKMIAADTAIRITTECVQLLGGYGFVKEYPVERMMRDAKITQIYEGTSQVQKMVIASTF